VAFSQIRLLNTIKASIVNNLHARGLKRGNNLEVGMVAKATRTRQANYLSTSTQQPRFIGVTWSGGDDDMLHQHVFLFV
jgi:hypothetical protein